MEHQVGVSQQEYDEMLKECRHKGHSFTLDKFSRKTLVKLYNNEMYEYVKGERDRKIIVLDDIFKSDEFKSTSNFTILIKKLMKEENMSLAEAINMARFLYTLASM